MSKDKQCKMDFLIEKLVFLCLRGRTEVSVCVLPGGRGAEGRQVEDEGQTLQSRESLCAFSLARVQEGQQLLQPTVHHSPDLTADAHVHLASDAETHTHENTVNLLCVLIYGQKTRRLIYDNFLLCSCECL